MTTDKKIINAAKPIHLGVTRNRYTGKRYPAALANVLAGVWVSS
jgi:hypothetical protein